MALLQIKTSTKIQATISIDSDTAAKLDHYAALTGAHADKVIEQGLEFVFGKDKDFQAYLQKQSGKTAPASLKVRRKTAAEKSRTSA